MILILSNKWDVTVDFVVHELRNRRASFIRVNTEDLTQESVSVRFPAFSISVSHKNNAVSIGDQIRVVWNRRPGKPFDDVEKALRPSAGVQQFVNNQWYTWLESIQLLPKVRWINHPQSNDAMENKLRQLNQAVAKGFQIPETLVSNDPKAIREFCRMHNRVVAKALYSPLIEEEISDSFVFTTEVSHRDMNDGDELRIAPSIFQKMIAPKSERRVTVVGDEVFVVKVILPSGGAGEAVDWRTVKDGVTFERDTLPLDVEDRCRKYVKDCGLLFGALDLIESDGEYYFLEINPNGEWGWLQKTVGVPIAEALSDLLVQLDCD